MICKELIGKSVRVCDGYKKEKLKGTFTIVGSAEEGDSLEVYPVFILIDDDGNFSTASVYWCELIKEEVKELWIKK